MDLRLEIQKTNVGIKTSILEIPCVPIFKQSGLFLLFRTDIAQKLILGRNFKDFSPDLESAPQRYHVCQFSVKTDNFEFFGLNLGQLPKYMRCFGSNNTAGVTERTGWKLK